MKKRLKICSFRTSVIKIVGDMRRNMRTGREKITSDLEFEKGRNVAHFSIARDGVIKEFCFYKRGDSVKYDKISEYP